MSGASKRASILAARYRAQAIEAGVGMDMIGKLMQGLEPMATMGYANRGGQRSPRGAGHPAVDPWKVLTRVVYVVGPVVQA